MKERNRLQDAHAKDDGEDGFLRRSCLQLPDHPHRKTEDEEVEDDVKDAGRAADSIRVIAGAG